MKGCGMNTIKYLLVVFNALFMYWTGLESEASQSQIKNDSAKVCTGDKVIKNFVHNGFNVMVYDIDPAQLPFVTALILVLTFPQPPYLPLTSSSSLSIFSANLTSFQAKRHDGVYDSLEILMKLNIYVLWTTTKAKFKFEPNRLN
ncbi:hypothetical protein EVAR_97711_1 [Eumeta japonica]|uniref:Uncharacterized protein n=1 Tax=Eumeta variegata TaxID=151549 RepID=A0A4C1Y030_EUMVA|nr:hypothetical protein EVAR_97711_1 [Eumeta japonica]